MLLCPDNAGANAIVDHLVLDADVAQLPSKVFVSHFPNDDSELAERAVQVHTDSAGCSQRLAPDHWGPAL